MTARTCDQCSKRLITQRAGARFCDDICKARWHNAERSKQGGAAKRITAASEADVHALADARAAQEATKLKDHYSQVIYQGIVERLERGSVHADDLEALFPENEDERTMCRKLVGAQFGSLASRHYIREKERRKSLVASRKGAKSSVWEFTRKGRERLAGIRTGVSDPQGPGGAVACVPCAASADSNEVSHTGKGPAQTHGATLDRPASSQGNSPAGARSTYDAVTGEQGSPAGSTQPCRQHPAGESRPNDGTLFELKPEPLSAHRHSEAA